jgi:hypothetical protein
MLQIDALVEGDVFGAVLEALTAAVPEPILALVLFGSIGTAYYMVQQRFLIPLVMFLLVGGVTFATAPVSFNQAVIAGAVLAIAGIGYGLLQRVRT